MFFDKVRQPAIVTLLLFLAFWVTFSPSTICAQTNDAQALKQKINDLVKQQKYVEALPLLEKAVVADPGDYDMHFKLAFALLAQANVTQETSEKKALRVRSRNEFIKAKEMGEKDPIVDALIQSIPLDGSTGSAFSKNPEADALMNQGEAFFSQGKLDEALVSYQRALQFDPKLYYAALFSGDVYHTRKDWEQAEIWYQKAIAIDPTIETAYRYSASPYMEQEKYDMARDRYVEAYITEPYSKYSIAGLSRWATTTKTDIGHPKIDVPVSVSFDEKGNPKTALDASLSSGGKDTEVSAWTAYGNARALWYKEKFAKTFPSEKSYRHSLSEEVDALRAAVHAASGLPIENLSPSLAKLKELDDKGLLEAYVLLARPDPGMGADFPTYLAQNRDKLRRYVLEYVVNNGGK